MSQQLVMGVKRVADVDQELDYEHRRCRAVCVKMVGATSSDGFRSSTQRRAANN